jgi:hypothetical protein
MEIFPSGSHLFASKGIDIDQFTIKIAHNTTHLKGVHGKGLEKCQENGMSAGQNSLQKIRMGKLLDEFGLSHLPIVPH